MNRALRFTLLGLAVVVVAAGCGSRTSPEAEWAENVCAAVLPYAKEMKDAYSTVRRERARSGTEARAAVSRSLTKARGLTNDVVLKLKAIPAPATKDGRGRYVKLALLGAAMRVRHDLAAFQSNPNDVAPSLSIPPSHHGPRAVQDAIAGAAGFIYAYIELSAKTVPWVTDAPRYTHAIEKADSCKHLNAVMRSSP
jgi:hypothetical protein